MEDSGILSTRFFLKFDLKYGNLLTFMYKVV